MSPIVTAQTAPTGGALGLLTNKLTASTNGGSSTLNSSANTALAPFTVSDKEFISNSENGLEVQ